MLLSVAVPTALKRASSLPVAAKPVTVAVGHRASAVIALETLCASAPLVTACAQSAVRDLPAVNVEMGARANSKGVSVSSPFIYHLSSSLTALHRHCHRHRHV